jgi:hypothetical protein
LKASMSCSAILVASSTAMAPSLLADSFVRP